MYNFKITEEKILKLWTKKSIYEKSIEQNKGKTPFYFLQGPPYTSGKLHIAHAWNNSMKDFVLRYKRMNHFEVWDRAGYDMHGLPTEHKVQAKFNLKNKDAIIAFGLDKFAKEAISFSKEMANYMNNDLKRLGIWMDFDNAYMPINPEYIEGVWFLIKKAYEKDRLYEGRRTLSWCADCATALAKHEQEYKLITDTSIFVKFKVKNKNNEYLVIWTTTAWTTIYNLAIMANPELDYIKIKVDDEYWILAEGLAGIFMGSVVGKPYEIIERFKGEKLAGLEYEHPWKNEIKDYAKLKKKHPKLHTVIMSAEYVNLSAGSGLVHCAPGCGPEDYEVGYQNNLPAYNNLTEEGLIPDGMGNFSSWKAKTDDNKFIQALKESGVLIATTEIEHDYAHCERCHNPIVFRATKQWFFKVEDLKGDMIKGNEQIHWVPESGKNAFRSWLENLRDNSITKQRFWGTPFPLWKCSKCNEILVIGSRKEIEEHGGQIPENLHKPWIDEVKLICKCNGEMIRHPDILDVWIDAGAASWSCLDYPQRTDLFKKYFPADFILEAKEQVRGWFNMLMVTSIIALDKEVPFKNCHMHGMLTDIEGVKMSKSLGNVISPYKMIDKYGADTLRYYFGSTKAGEDINFSWDEAKLRYKNLAILWNIHKYLLDLNGHKELIRENLSLEEKYILSKLNSTIKKVTNVFNTYNIDEAPKLIEDFYLDLSRTYIQLTRDKVNTENQGLVATIIFICLINTLKLLAPICPFITEEIYQNLKEKYELFESIHLEDWPSVNATLINEKLEKHMEDAQNIMQSILAGREKMQRGVRWPLQNIIIKTKNKELKDSVGLLKELIKNQTNIKDITIVEDIDYTLKIKPNYNALGKEFGDQTPDIVGKLEKLSPKEIIKELDENNEINIENKMIKRNHLIFNEEVPENIIAIEVRGGVIYLDKNVPEKLETEGYVRELNRKIQSQRKDEGLNKKERIRLSITSSLDISKYKEEIMNKVGAELLDLGDKNYSVKFDFKIKNKEFKISFEKV